MTTSTIAAVIDKLATLQAAIEGVQNAYGHDEAPNAFRSGQLPAFVTVPGPATHTARTHGNEVVIETREYRMLLYVCSVTQPSDVARQMNLVEPFFDRVLAKFKSDIDLSGLTITASMYRGDGGVDVLEYAGTLYAGIEFMVSVSRQL